MKIRIDPSGDGVCQACNHVGVVVFMPDSNNVGQWACHSSSACADRQAVALRAAEMKTPAYRRSWL